MASFLTRLTINKFPQGFGVSSAERERGMSDCATGCQFFSAKGLGITKLKYYTGYCGWVGCFRGEVMSQLEKWHPKHLSESPFPEREFVAPGDSKTEQLFHEFADNSFAAERQRAVPSHAAIIKI